MVHTTALILALLWPARFADTWKDVIEIIVLITAAALGLIQLELFRRQVQNEKLKDRRLRTLDVDARIVSRTKERDAIKQAFPPQKWNESSIPMSEIEAAFKNNPEIRVMLLGMLGEFETLSLPICAKIADEDLAFEIIGSELVWYGIVFFDFMKYRQTTEKRPRLYVYLIHLTERWKERLEKEGQSPLFLRSK